VKKTRSGVDLNRDRREVATSQSGSSTGARPHVRVPELAVGLLIVSACILGALLWQRSVERGTPVLIAGRDLERGQLITNADLSAVVVTSDEPLRLLKASAASQVVGLRVLTDIPEGTPMSVSQLSPVEPVDARHVLVGVTVTASQAPLDLIAGDSVRLVSVNSEVDGSRRVEVLLQLAQIWEISNQNDFDSRRSVTLRLPIDSASLALGHDELHLLKVGQ